MKQHRAGCQSALEVRIEILGGGSLQKECMGSAGGEKDLRQIRAAGLSVWIAKEGEKQGGESEEGQGWDAPLLRLFYRKQRVPGEPASKRESTENVHQGAAEQREQRFCHRILEWGRRR